MSFQTLLPILVMKTHNLSCKGGAALAREIMYRIVLSASQPGCRFRARYGAGSPTSWPGSDRTLCWRDLSARLPQIAWKGPAFYLHDYANMLPAPVNLSAGQPVSHRW